MTPGKSSFLVSNSFPAAVAPKRRSGFSSGSGVGEALRASMVVASSSGAETAHAIAVERKGLYDLFEEPESALGKNPAVFTAADETAVSRELKLRMRSQWRVWESLICLRKPSLLLARILSCPP